jgi:DNA-binding NtrC family response regulator
MDIPDLVGLFLRKSNARLGKNVLDIAQPAMQAMMKYDWPGNIRELANDIDRSVLFCDGPTLEESHLPSDIR